MYQERTCSPLWSNVFGCKEGNTIWVSNDAISEHEDKQSFSTKLKSLFGAEQEVKSRRISFLQLARNRCYGGQYSLNRGCSR